jgi:hypothetical protein
VAAPPSLWLLSLLRNIRRAAALVSVVATLLNQILVASGVMSCFWNLADSQQANVYVRFWNLADSQQANVYVRFWHLAEVDADSQNVR